MYLQQGVQIIRSGFGCLSVYPYSLKIPGWKNELQRSNIPNSLSHALYITIMTGYRRTRWFRSCASCISSSCSFILVGFVTRRLYLPITM